MGKTTQQSIRDVLESLARKTYRNRDIHPPARKFLENENIDSAQTQLLNIIEGLIDGEPGRVISYTGKQDNFATGYSTALTEIRERLKR